MYDVSKFQKLIIFWQDCKAKLGLEASRKREELEQRQRLVEGLLLDKDILTQLKVAARQIRH